MEDADLVQLLLVKRMIKHIEENFDSLLLSFDLVELLKNDKEIINIKLYLSKIDFSIEEFILKIQNKG